MVGKDRPFKAPSGTDFTLANGLKVSYWYRPELPLMNLTTVVDYGADHDPATKAGRASLVADMLSSGSGSRNAKQFGDSLISTRRKCLRLGRANSHIGER